MGVQVMGIKTLKYYTTRKLNVIEGSEIQTFKEYVLCASPWI